MLGIAIRMKKGLIALCNVLENLAKYQLTEQEWLLMEKIHKFLTNFKILSTKLGGEKYVTIPLVVPSFNMLIDKIESTCSALEMKIDRNYTEDKLINAYRACRDKMIKHYKMTNWIYCTTLILDPRHKLEQFDMTTWGKDLKKESYAKFKEIFTEYQKNTTLANLPLQQCSSVVENDDDLIDFDQFYLKATTSSLPQTPETELERYLVQQRTSSGEDILQWWKRNESQFPTLARMARDFFSICATSVPAERLFSKAALTITKHRNRLSNETARWLLCINSWSNKLN